jgi:GTP-binding protein
MGDHASRRRRLTTFVAELPELFPPRAADTGLLEDGRRLFAREAHFVFGAADPAVLPPGDLPEIAFAGRSNVGKSSLVNALTGRRMLARTSHTPGRTRQINFFDLGGRLMLVDLPGYGFAQAAKSDIARWTALVRRYLQSRPTLRRVCLLLDARHGIKDADRPVMKLLDEAAVSYQAVLTKTDKVRPGDLAAILDALAAEFAAHPAAHPEIHLTSAVAKSGIAALRASLAGLGSAALATAVAPR